MSANPFYFGTSTTQLFGIYDPPQSAGRRGVVLCQPWGQEYLRAHQSIRHLARLLARQRCHALRFDYFGCGDSAGRDEEGSIAQWLNDIATAIDELKAIAGLRSVGLIGLRFGASLAALTAAGRRDVDRLVLWDPIIDGAAYVTEKTKNSVGRGEAGGVVQVAGFPLTAELQESMATILLTARQERLPPTLLVSTVQADTYHPLERALVRGGVDVRTICHPGPSAWSDAANFGSGGMPVAALDAIVEWMSS